MPGEHEQEQQEQQTTALDMSDEDFLNLPADAFSVPAGEEGEEGDQSSEFYSESQPREDDYGLGLGDPDEDEEEGDEPAGDDEPEGKDDSDDDDGDDDEDDPENDGSGSGGEAEDADADDGEEDDADAEDTDSDDDQPAQGTADDFVKAVTAPFNANGKQVQFDKPEDIVRLMQLGLGFNKKMQDLKPNLRILRTLQNAELLDEGKINFLIDVVNGDQKAIAKLLKDHSVDPVQFDIDQGESYEAGDHAASESEVELDQVLETLRTGEHYGAITDLVGKQWDQASRELVAQSPAVLRTLESHMANGVYEIVSSEMERKRALGQLTEPSDIENYRAVGDELYAQGAFAHLASPPPASGEGQGGKGDEGKKPSASDESEKAKKQRRDERRRAASPSKNASTQNNKGGQGQDDNILNMSDEEFAKKYDSRLM